MLITIEYLSFVLMMPPKDKYLKKENTSVMQSPHCTLGRLLHKLLADSERLWLTMQHFEPLVAVKLKCDWNTPRQALLVNTCYFMQWILFSIALLPVGFHRSGLIAAFPAGKFGGKLAESTCPTWPTSKPLFCTAYNKMSHHFYNCLFTLLSYLLMFQH